MLRHWGRWRNPERLYVLHDISPVDYDRQQCKEDLCQISDGRSYGYELLSSLILNAAGKLLGSAVFELRTRRGLLSSQNESLLPFAERILTGRERAPVADREFDDLGFSGPASRPGLSSARNIMRIARLGGWSGRKRDPSVPQPRCAACCAYGPPMHSYTRWAPRPWTHGAPSSKPPSASPPLIAGARI